MPSVLVPTGSLLLAMLIHASYPGWLLALFPATSFEPGLAWQTTLAAALCSMLAVVIGAFGQPGRADVDAGHRRG